MMLQNTSAIMSVVSGGIAGLGCVQAIIGAGLLSRFGRRAALPDRSGSAGGAFLPPVTVLKPLYGDEPLLEDEWDDEPLLDDEGEPPPVLELALSEELLDEPEADDEAELALLLEEEVVTDALAGPPQMSMMQETPARQSASVWQA